MAVDVSAEAAATLPVVFRKSRRDTRSLEYALMEGPLKYVFPVPLRKISLRSRGSFVHSRKVIRRRRLPRLANLPRPGNGIFGAGRTTVGGREVFQTCMSIPGGGILSDNDPDHFRDSGPARRRDLWGGAGNARRTEAQRALRRRHGPPARRPLPRVGHGRTGGRGNRLDRRKVQDRQSQSRRPMVGKAGSAFG